MREQIGKIKKKKKKKKQKTKFRNKKLIIKKV